MAKKKPKKAQKSQKRPVGRPSKGPAVSVTFLLPKELHDRVERLRKRASRELTRTEALQRTIEAGLALDEKLLSEIR